MVNDFDNYETSYFSADRGYVCSYCGSEHLVIDDAFDEHGNYGGTRYYCVCEQAKLEQEMKHKVSALTRSGMTDLIDEVMAEYAPRLVQDDVRINRIKFEGELREFFINQLYSQNRRLQDMTNVELLHIIKDNVLNLRLLYERRHEDDTFEKEDITVSVHNYGANMDLWEVYMVEDYDDVYDHIGKADLTSREDAVAYIESLKDRYNITIK
jgi:hypothetical protein